MKTGDRLMMYDINKQIDLIVIGNNDHATG